MLYQHHAIFMEYKSLNIIREHGFRNDDRRGSVLKKDSSVYSKWFAQLLML